MPFLILFWGWFPTKIDKKKKVGTHILTSLLDLGKDAEARAICSAGA